MQINLEFDSQALAAPQSFRDAIAAAADLIDATFSDEITVNIAVGYGEIQGMSLTNGEAEGGPAQGWFESYSQVRSWLLGNAGPEVQSGIEALPAGSSVQGQTEVAVWSAQEKLMGKLPADYAGLDGEVGFATDIPTDLLEGAALHELTHAMGRIQDGPEPDIFDLYRYTNANTLLFDGASTSPVAYFSLDGGKTAIADYGQSSDPSDFLNTPSTATDAFDEYYDAGSFQGLSRIDVLQMQSLGFDLGVNASAPNDFNGDGRSDVLWTNSAGSVVEWLMNGETPISGIYVGGSPWTMVGTGDFNGDGRSDLLWRNTDTGSVVEWDMNGGEALSSGLIGGNSDWVVAGTGDFDGNGTSDLLWRQNSTGALVEWGMNDRAVTSQGLIEQSQTMDLVGTGDFNGDGRTDVLLRDTSSGAVTEDFMKGSTMTSSRLLGGDLDWSIAGTGDFNGDGTTDIIWHQNSTGALVEWDMSGGTPASSGAVAVNPGLSVVGTGDFNGDRMSDILVRDNTSGGVLEWQMEDRSIVAAGFLGGGPGWSLVST